MHRHNIVASSVLSLSITNGLILMRQERNIAFSLLFSFLNKLIKIFTAILLLIIYIIIINNKINVAFFFNN